MKLARKSGDEVLTAAVNLALIATPEQLAAMAGAKSDVDEDSIDHVGDRDGDYCGDHSSGSEGVGEFCVWVTT